MFGIDLLAEIAMQGYPTGWFSPTYKYLNPVWDYAINVLRPVITRSSENKHLILLEGGGSIEFWSLADNKDAGRSRKYKRIGVDEAAFVSYLENIWKRALRATLSDFRGDAWFFSSPNGTNYFKTLFDWGQDELAHKDWRSWQMPTATNPYIPPDEIEAARDDMTELEYAQEYLAQFIDSAGGVFRRLDECLVLDRPGEPYQSRFVMGVDWAQKYDYTVLSVIDANSKKQVDLDRFNRMDWELQYERLKLLADKWKVARIIAETNSIGSPNLEQLQRRGLPVEGFETTGTTKPTLIEGFALAIERGELKLLNDPVLKTEMQAYERTVSRETGRSKYNAPLGYHDDTVMATAIAWHAVQSSGWSDVMDYYRQRTEQREKERKERGY